MFVFDILDNVLHNIFVICAITVDIFCKNNFPFINIDSATVLFSALTLISSVYSGNLLKNDFRFFWEGKGRKIVLYWIYFPYNPDWTESFFDGAVGSIWSPIFSSFIWNVYYVVKCLFNHISCKDFLSLACVLVKAKIIPSKLD